jgi:adenosylcobinamide-GDP ribazoletransferase
MPAPERPLAPVAALAFLTRLPLPGRRGTGPDDVLRAAPFFPLVGAALGLGVGGAAVGLATVVPALLAGLLAVALEVALTGALHVDGLADSADGLAGHDRDHSLAIMRDHSLGAYGACALVLDLAIKAAALATLAEAQALAPIVAALAISRATPLPLARLLPYARQDGTGRALATGAGNRLVATGIGLAMVIAVAVSGADALALLLGAAVVTAAVAIAARHRLGGVTGDVMGAAVELAAVGALVVASATVA